MRVILTEIAKNWNRILNVARLTQSKEASNKEPSDIFKKKILFSEHSPIRLMRFGFRIEEIPYCNHVHIARHKHGIEHFVTSQRSIDDRDSARQDAPVIQECDVNAQAVISISRKRLCNKTDSVTKEAWSLFVQAIKPIEPSLAVLCVRECVYRNGICPEPRTCGYNFTDDFNRELEVYIEGFEKQISCGRK